MLVGAGLVGRRRCSRAGIAPPLLRRPDAARAGGARRLHRRSRSPGRCRPPTRGWRPTARSPTSRVFAGALALVRLVPGRWAAVLSGVALGCVRRVRVGAGDQGVPGGARADETFARLREPFGYWNAVGLMAALGVPPLLWLAARRTGHAAVNALAWPGARAAVRVPDALLLARRAAGARRRARVLVRGRAAAAARAPLPLIAARAAAAPVVAWAFARDALSTERIPLAARSDAGHDLGALLLLMLRDPAGGRAGGRLLRRPAAAERRARAGSRGGRCSARARAASRWPRSSPWPPRPAGSGPDLGRLGQAHQPARRARPANTPDRLTATSSVRARYWSEALDIYDDRRSGSARAPAPTWSPARATAATGSPSATRTATGSRRSPTSGWSGSGCRCSPPARGWSPRIARDRPAAARPRAAVRPRADRAADAGAVVVVFGVHSLIDWTWFVPGNAVVALLCAGWVAGRGPLRARPRRGRGGRARAAPPWRARLRATARSAARRRGRARRRARGELGGAPARARGPRRRTRAHGRRRAGKYDAARASARDGRASATRCRSSRCGCSRSSRTRAATQGGAAATLEQRRRSGSPPTPRRGAGSAATG